MTSLRTITRRLAVVVCSVLLMVGTFFLSVAPASAASHTVTMGGAKGLVFEPNALTIASGDTVTFAVGQLPPHNVVFESVPGGDKELAAKLSHKGLEGSGASFAVDFSGAPAGEYTYFCLPHRGAGMVGKITVQ